MKALFSNTCDAPSIPHRTEHTYGTRQAMYV